MCSNEAPDKGATLRVETVYEICPQSLDLQNLLREINDCKTDESFKKITNVVVAKYCKEFDKTEGVVLRNVLMNMSVKFSNKKGLRTHIYEQLNAVQIKETTLFDHIIEDAMNEIFESINQLKVFNTLQSIHYLNFLSSYMQNFEDSSQFARLIERVHLFYLCILEVYASQLFSFKETDDSGCEIAAILKEEYGYVVLNNALKHLIVIVVKVNNEVVDVKQVQFIEFCQKILECNEQLKYESTAKCALLLAYFLRCLPNEEKEGAKWVEHPMIDFFECESLHIKNLHFINVFTNDKMALVLNSVIFHSMDCQSMLDLQINEMPLLEYLFFNILNYGKSMTGFPEQIILITRTMAEMSDFLGQLPNFAEVYKEGINFCWAHLDHFVENVVHATKIFLRKILQYASILHEDDTSMLEHLFDDLNSMSQFSKVRLIALEIASESIDCLYILQNFENLQSYLLTLMPDTNMGLLAGDIYIRIMAKHLTLLEDDEFVAIWIQPVLNNLREAKLETSGVYQKIVTHAFRIKPDIFRKLFPPRFVGTSAESAIILRCVHFARTKGISFPVDDGGNPSDYWRGLVLKKKLELFMIHQDDDVRLCALQAMVECQKSTEELQEWEVLYLLSYFSYNVATQIPCVRKKIGSLYKKLLIRFQASYNVIQRRITSERNLLKTKNETDSETLRENEKTRKFYRGFVMQFLGLLLGNLTPDSNYSRRNLSLQLLLVLKGVATAIEWSRSFNDDDVENLKNLLNDGYETNKTMAVEVLTTLSGPCIGFDSEITTHQYFEKCLILACDIRPSKSLTAVYMLQLVLHSDFPVMMKNKNLESFPKSFRYLMLAIMTETLNEMFEMSKKDIIKAAKTSPFHGLLLSIRNLIASRNVQEHNKLYCYLFNVLVTLCLTIKNQIMPVVCSASPEGHVPDHDVNLSEVDQSFTAQMVSVYAWKTMKEIMLLLAELVRQTIMLEMSCALLSEEQLFDIGDFFVDVFIQSKHRGVFEQAGVAFSIIAKEFSRSKVVTIRVLPDKWLMEAISLCTGKKTDDRLCSTRRSAGLPFLVLSIVSTGIQTRTTAFNKTVEELLQVANDDKEENEEYRVHCLNILRFLFINAKLADQVPAYVGEAVEAALVGFKSKTWKVRNSSTLLYSALITRIFGVQRTQDSEQLCSKNRMTVAVFYVRYPKLFEFLLVTLFEECSEVNSLILHPVLLILARLYPSHNDKINDLLHKQVPCINSCMANPAFRTRELAARASVSLISVKTVGGQLMENFNKIATKSVTENECHGLLLQIWHLLRSNRFNEDLPIVDFLNKSVHILEQSKRRFSDLVVALYMDIIVELLIKFPRFGNMEILQQIVALCLGQRDLAISTCRHNLDRSRFQLLLCILVNKFYFAETAYNIVTREIMQYLYGHDEPMRRHILLLLIYLNQVCSDEKYPEHPLITAGELEFPQDIQELVDSFDDASKKQLLIASHSSLKYFFHGQLKCDSDMDDARVLVLLLLRFYPCIFKHFNNKQAILNMFAVMTRCEREDVVAVVVGCLSSFIMSLEERELAMDFKRVIAVLMWSASPGAADFRRLSAAQFLVVNQQFCRSEALSDLDRYNLFNIIVVLLEDDEVLIRNTMSSYPAKEKMSLVNACTWDTIPDKARSDLMLASVTSLSNEVAICFLVSWSMRHLPEVTSDGSEVYDRSELNPFAENIPVSYSACKVLNNLLWPLGENLHYDDKSIFLEEQTLLVTTVILNSLIKVPSPMMEKLTKTTVICALKCIVKFLEDFTVGTDFPKSFKHFFNAKIVKYIRKTLTVDYSSVKYFLQYLYNPVLKPNPRFPLK